MASLTNIPLVDQFPLLNGYTGDDEHLDKVFKELPNFPVKDAIAEFIDKSPLWDKENHRWSSIIDAVGLNLGQVDVIQKLIIDVLVYFGFTNRAYASLNVAPYMPRTQDDGIQELCDGPTLMLTVDGIDAAPIDFLYETHIFPDLEIPRWMLFTHKLFESNPNRQLILGLEMSCASFRLFSVDRRMNVHSFGLFNMHQDPHRFITYILYIAALSDEQTFNANVTDLGLNLTSTHADILVMMKLRAELSKVEYIDFECRFCEDPSCIGFCVIPGGRENPMFCFDDLEDYFNSRVEEPVVELESIQVHQ